MSNIKKIYIATGNSSKFKNFLEFFQWIDTDIVVEIVPKMIEVEENGLSISENSRIKVEPYKGLYEFPVISNDFGLDFEDKVAELLDKSKVKRQALQAQKEEELTQEEIGGLMYEYYRSIATKYGGKIKCVAFDTFSLLKPDGEIVQSNSVRNYELVDREVEDFNIYHPLDVLRFSTSAQKFMDQFTEKDEKLDKAPLINALKDLISYL